MTTARKKTFAIFLSVLLLLVLFSTIYYTKIHYKSELPETTLVKSFDNSQAKVISSEIYFWARLDEKYNTLKDLSMLVEDFSQQMGVVKNNVYSNNTVQNDTTKKVELIGTTKENRMVAINAQINSSEGDEKQKYISLSVVEDLSYSGLEHSREAAMEVFRKYQITPKVNSCITGRLDGKLDYNSLNDVTKAIFRESDAKKVEGMRDRNLISVSAYSPVIEDYIRVNGKKVNINLAIRYNANEDKTYIWLATPVITTEY